MTDPIAMSDLAVLLVIAVIVGVALLLWDGLRDG